MNPVLAKAFAGPGEVAPIAPSFRRPLMDQPNHNRATKMQLSIVQVGNDKTFLCNCDQEQTVRLIAKECPMTKSTGGIEKIHSTGTDAVEWIGNLGVCVHYL